jgi:hypothetical protein
MNTKRELKVIGWREWVSFPDFDVTTIKAKIDTGARTSSLHALAIEEFRVGTQEMVRFQVHPEQRSSKESVVLEVPIIDRRSVKASSGQSEDRLVVLARLELLGEVWDAELTLTRRDEMGFRMLLGRQAMRHRFLVDPGTSFLNGRRVKGTRRLKRRKKP